MDPRTVPAAAGHAWAAALPPSLSRQAALLRALVDAVDADVRWEALELGCSTAAGRADELSDLDVGLWHVPGTRPDDGEVDRLVRALGEVVEVNAQPWDGVPRWWVQYADGTQLDLVVGAADARGGRAPGGVALLDRAGRFAEEFVPSVLHADVQERRRWALDGWEALGDVAKHVRRGSLLEAADQLHRARQQLFRVWAANSDADYPVFGLTSLLDAPTDLPSGIESTYPTIDTASVLAAARALAGLLERAGHQAVPRISTPLSAFVRGRLSRALDRTT